MKVMRVMQLALTLDTGGLERVVVTLASELSRIGRVDSSICTVGQTQGNLISAEIAPAVSWTELRGAPHFTLKTAVNLVRTIRRKRIDLLHAHGTQPLVYALTANLLTGVPLVFTKHNAFEDLTFFDRHPLFQRLACRRVRSFVGVSEASTQMLKRVFSRVAERCVTLINGTELPSRSMRRRAAAVRNGGSDKAPRVIATVCRLAPEKDLPTLLRAFSRLRQDIDAELWVVGDGPERARLMRLAEELCVDKAVRFWGFRGKVQQILACADVFVNSSTTEGISISILEAMSLGLPIVATAVGGTPTIVTPGENGILVSPGQHDELATAMLHLLKERELRRRYGENGLEQIRVRWSLEKMAARYLELYEAVRDGTLSHSAVA